MVLVHKNIKRDTNITKPTPCELLTLQQVWLNGRLFTLWVRTCALIINQNMNHKTELIFRHPSIHGWIHPGLSWRPSSIHPWMDGWWHPCCGLHDSPGHGGSSLSRDGHTSRAAAAFFSFSSCSESTMSHFQATKKLYLCSMSQVMPGVFFMLDMLKHLTYQVSRRRPGKMPKLPELASFNVEE